MSALNVILNIVIFLLCLSFVVCIHEAGHLAVAKMFNVYCFEYSIGFGPAIYKHRFKKHKSKRQKELTQDIETKDKKELGETQFTIRALPLGGYVAMAGEDADELEDGTKIPKERTINGINHGKQILIMLAGITMNFILAYLLFFCSFAFCNQRYQDVFSNQVTVSQYQDDNKTEYLGYQAGLRTGDRILYAYQEFHNLRNADGELVETAYYPYGPEDTPVEIKVYQNFNEVKEGSPLTYNDLTPDSLQYYVLDPFHMSRTSLGEGVYAFTLPDSLKGLYPDNNSTRTFHLTYLEKDSEERKTLDLVLGTTEAKTDKDTIVYNFDILGISPYIQYFKLPFKDSFRYAGIEFKDLFVNLYTALGQLFTPKGLSQVGGIISVYRMSASGVESGSAGYFLLLWGYISLNLGCFNLLPIPGLDGWQALIAIIETIIRKKLPKKMKSIANNIGLAVMMVLAILLVIKDLL